MSDIAILGAGYVGETLARRLAPLGHAVRIANSRNPETLSRLTLVAGVQPMWASEVFDGAEIAILAVPETVTSGLGSDVIGALARVPIVIDSGNYNSRRDGDVPELLAGKPVGLWLSEQLGQPLFRVFNNIQAHDIAVSGRPVGDPERFALPISGPNGPHLARVHALVEELGFEPVYNGELSESWRHQLGTTTYCTNLDASRLRIELATARLDQTLESNQHVYFLGDAVKSDMADGLAIMRNQAIALREYFGDGFGDPEATAERLGNN